MPLRPDSPHPVLPMHQLNKMAANTPTDFSARPDMHSQPDVGATSPDINPNVTTDVPNDDRFVVSCLLSSPSNALTSTHLALTCLSFRPSISIV